MFELVTSAGLALLALLGLSHLLSANLFWRRRGREFFGEAVRHFLISKGNGGELVLRPRQTELRLRMRRDPGRSAERARLTLLVPAGAASRGAATLLRERLRARGLEAHFDADTPGEVAIEVPDIWAPDAGEVGGEALRCVVDTLRIPEDSRYIIDLSGPESLRAVRRLRSRLRG